MRLDFILIFDETVHRRISQAIRWMTRLILVMKGVASYEMLRVNACNC